ncbi:hypothetical protein [Citrobacter arsenatis]|uniref:hypothetical protein n=1 Tax=Citrobacter arsenatis TaxID=2546350 RepID=UPI00300E0224
MNHYSPVSTVGNDADAENTRTFLQQTVDHYPRLAAFCFTLALPYRESMADYRSLILRFHTEVWKRTGEYSRQRQQALRHSPPTILRWMSVVYSHCCLGTASATGANTRSRSAGSSLLPTARRAMFCITSGLIVQDGSAVSRFH